MNRKWVITMYNLWIPIFNRDFTEDELSKKIRELKRCNPQLVLITFNRFLFDKEKLANEKKRFNSTKDAFEKAGFKVGAWLIPTIGYGKVKNINEDAPFTHLTKVTGEVIGDAYCPLDDDFSDGFCFLMKEIASTGVEAIMFEDDFTFTGGKISPSAMSCCCDRHIMLYESILGEKIVVSKLPELVYHSGPNKYRKAWFEMQGGVLKNFCAKIEKETHDVYPEVRIGMSANASSYIQEGVTVDELARIIAGKNRPFIRLTGAPYWQTLSNYATNMEAVRIQTHWCKGDIELMTEGDTYPRPRHWVSANKLEIYDMILRADNRSHSILKYMIDYNSSADYETGYVDRHVRNIPTYNDIENRFCGKSVGLRIFETPEIINSITFNDDFPATSYGEAHYLPLISQQFTTDNSIPTTYEETEGATLCFGENAKYLSEDALNKGVILDAPAAKILFEKGVDIGINGYKRATSPNAEAFKDLGEVVTCTTVNGSVFYSFDLKENAILDSTFLCTPAGLGVVPSVVDANKYDNFPACFKYENSKGQRFMVYAFSAQTVLVSNKGWQTGVFRSYTRQQQLIDGIKWLQKGNGLPAVLSKAPELYILCNQNGDSLSVGLWNIFPDEILTPEITLNDKFSSIDCFNCDGEIIGDKVRLNAPIPPYSHAFFTVKK